VGSRTVKVHALMEILMDNSALLVVKTNVILISTNSQDFVLTANLSPIAMVKPHQLALITLHKLFRSQYLPLRCLRSTKNSAQQYSTTLCIRDPSKFLLAMITRSTIFMRKLMVVLLSLPEIIPSS
jgi:hypothetical protein